MDVNMPEMGGRTSMRKIRKFEKMEGIRHCKIVFISANIDDSEIKSCLEDDVDGTKGGDLFLKKPVSLKGFKDAIGM